MRSFLASVIGASALLGGCTTTGTGPVAITKVNPFHLSATTQASSDPMLEFERRRYFLGAVEKSEEEGRYGNYFSIFWKTQTKSPATVRLEFRQGNTGAQVYSEEIYVASPKAANVTKLEITGEAYRQRGKVTQWKASIVENGSVVAEYKSYLWQ